MQDTESNGKAAGELLIKKTAIRKATEEDIPRILELYRELAELSIATSQAESRRSPSPDDYRRVFAEIGAFPGYELLVAEYQGEVIGTMILVTVPTLSHSALPWLYVDNAVVDHRYRGQGLGKLLMEYAIGRAKETGCYRVGLTSGKRRHKAHRFYRSLDFQVTSYGFRLYF